MAQSKLGAHTALLFTLKEVGLLFYTHSKMVSQLGEQKGRYA
jgi:hypothetical protein